MTTAFTEWSKPNLISFATESQIELVRQEVIIRELREDLKVALEEVRRLIVKAG